MRTETVNFLLATGGGGGDSGRRRRANLGRGEENPSGGGEKPGGGGACSSWRRGARARSNLLPSRTNRERERSGVRVRNESDWALPLSRSYRRRLVVGIIEPGNEEGRGVGCVSVSMPASSSMWPAAGTSVGRCQGTSVGRKWTAAAVQFRRAAAM